MTLKRSSKFGSSLIMNFYLVAQSTSSSGSEMENNDDKDSKDSKKSTGEQPKAVRKLPKENYPPSEDNDSLDVEDQKRGLDYYNKKMEEREALKENYPSLEDNDSLNNIEGQRAAYEALEAQKKVLDYHENQPQRKNDQKKSRKIRSRRIVLTKEGIILYSYTE